MNIKNTYNKFNNLFTEHPCYSEYINIFGEFPNDIVYDVFETINCKDNVVSPKNFFKVLINTVEKYIDNGNYTENVINIFINNINNSSLTKSSTILQTYFNEIKEIYDSASKYNILEHTEENRHKIINQSLKMVIHMAKRYQGLGVDIEDLISAGNVGLCVAWDKFKPNKISNKDRYRVILEDYPDELPPDVIEDILSESLQYGKIRELFYNYFNEHRIYTKLEVLKWINTNMKPAKFSSVANMWIRAYILEEINKHSRVVKKPKAEIDKDRIKHNGAYIKENILRFDISEEDENYNNLMNIKELHTEDNDICNENEYIFTKTLIKLMKDIPQRDKDVVMKAYGIGYPRAMSFKEISADMNITIARISQIVITATEKMKQAATIEDKNILIDLMNNE